MYKRFFKYVIQKVSDLELRTDLPDGHTSLLGQTSFDKLKPFGLCIHGCICGFSRKMVWLNVYTTNNDPKVIGCYFLKAVERNGGTAYMIRGDFGTENVLIKDMQNWPQRHGYHGTSYLEGASTQNQRIEGCWSYLRRQHIQPWMDIFKNLHENGEFSASDIDKNIKRLCVMALIQTELDLAVSMWNDHSIRQSRNSNAPKCQPNRMFNYPELWGSRNFICDVHQGTVSGTMCNFTDENLRKIFRQTEPSRGGHVFR